MLSQKQGPTKIDIPLRYAEAPIDVYGYPGAGTFTLTLFRKNDVPTRYEILHNQDWTHSTDSSLHHWALNEPRTQTDSPVGVAWVSPQEYVVPVVMEFYPERYSLRLFRTGCEIYGSKVVYAGDEIDIGYG